MTVPCMAVHVSPGSLPAVVRWRHRDDAFFSFSLKLGAQYTLSEPIRASICACGKQGLGVCLC